MPEEEIYEELDTEEEEAEEIEDEEAEEEEEESDGADDDEGEPEDLASAYLRLRKMDADDSYEPVESGEDGEEEPEPDDGSEEGDDEAEEEPEAADDGGYEDDRGSSDDAGGAGYVDTIKVLGQAIQRQAIQAAALKFKEDGIREFTMNDIYQRTQDGRVVYRNPDDPNRPFSNRMEAQQWIDSFNKQVRSELQKLAQGYYRENLKQVAPTVRMLRFGERFDRMPKQTQELFDDLIEDYEIRDRDGNIIGYRCDLDKMADKAERLSAKYSTPSRKSSAKIGKQKPQRKPALDTRASGSRSGGKKDIEVKDMSDAFLAIRKMNGGTNAG